MRSRSRKTVAWLSVAAVLLLGFGFWFVFGPPGVVDLIAYDEVEPGVIEVGMPCHNEVEGHFAWRFGDTIWIVATGSDPQRYSTVRDGCLTIGRIDLGEPIGDRRLMDGFDFSRIGPLS